jgi:WD40 repeat protein
LRYVLPLRDLEARTLALSPAGDLMAVGGTYGGLQIVRVKDGTIQHLLSRPEEVPEGLLVAFSRDGRRLVSARHDLVRLRIWDVATGRPERQLTAGAYPIRDLAMGDAETLVVATGAGAEVFDLRTGARRGLAKARFDLPVTHVVASASGIGAFGDRSGTVTVLDCRTARAGDRIPGTTRLAALDLSADGKLLALAYQNNSVQLASTSPAQRLPGWAWSTSDTPRRVQLDPRAERLLVAERSGRITLLDRRDARPLAQAASRPGGLQDFVASPDGALWVTAGRAGSVEILQSSLAPHRLLLPATLPPPVEEPPRSTLTLKAPTALVIEVPDAEVTSVAVGKRGRFIAVGSLPEQVSMYYVNVQTGTGAISSARLLFRRTPTGPPPARPGSRMVRVALTPNDTWLFAHGPRLGLARWAAMSGRPIPLAVRGLKDPVSLLPTHDGATMITSTLDRRVVGWTLDGNRRFDVQGIPDPYWIGVNPSGNVLIQIQGWDRIVASRLPSGARLWDTPSTPRESHEVLAVGFTPRGELATYHRTGFLRITDLETGLVVKRRRIPLPPDTARCAFRPDTVVLACAHASAISLFETATGAEVRTLALPGSRPDPARDLEWSLRGNALVTQLGRRQLVAYFFDHPADAEPFAQEEVLVRVRLGLPVQAPRAAVPAERLPPGSIIKPGRNLRQDSPRPHVAPPRLGQ